MKVFKGKFQIYSISSFSHPIFLYKDTIDLYLKNRNWKNELQIERSEIST